MYKHISKNKRNTVLLILGFIILIGAISAAFAYWFGDWSISVITIIIATVYALIQYFAASSIAVAMTGAHQIQKTDNPRLYNIVENLVISTGMPMPGVYIIDDPAPNAFATGRDPKHAVVAATTGLLDLMDDRELTAVMGHELSHVRNYDIRVSTMVFGLVCIVGFLSDIGLRLLIFGDRKSNDSDRNPIGLIVVVVVAILAPIAAAIAQMAVSRQREYLADMSSAKITRDPDGMISALKKLETGARPMQHQNTATEALYISNPLKKGTISNLFSTHPPIEKRIERLENGKKSF